MTQKEINEIFSENLRHYLQEFGYTQNEVADAIGVTQQAINTWVTGRNVPRIDKVSKLASFFGVKVTDLTDRHNPDMEEALEDAFNNPDMRTLFSLAKNCTPDQIQATITLLEQFKKMNNEE